MACQSRLESSRDWLEIDIHILYEEKQSKDKEKKLRSQSSSINKINDGKTNNSPEFSLSMPDRYIQVTKKDRNIINK